MVFHPMGTFETEGGKIGPMKRSRRCVSRPSINASIALIAALVSIPLIPAISGVPPGSVIPLAEVVGPAASPEPGGALGESRHDHHSDALAALTVYYEAAGESFAGKLAVAAVIRNRMKLKYQSDGTVKGTVLRARQFQPWITKNPYHIPLDLEKPSMRDSLLAWRLVQDGRNVVDGAVLFYNPKLVRTPYWAKVSQKVTTIGGHEFYAPPSRRA